LPRRVVPTVPIAYIEDLPEDTGPPSDHYTEATAGPFAELLWVEIRRIERLGRLSALEAATFELHLRGIRTTDIARAFGMPRSTVAYHLKQAIAKAQAVPHRGLLTCLVEAFGWRAALEHVFGGGKNSKESAAVGLDKAACD